jgi:hypothetical protein
MDQTRHNISETPEKWLILKLKNEETFYKVFASWPAGYLDGESWQMQSGIIKVEEDDDFYYFYGFSGSCYACRKEAYGVSTSYCQGVLDSVLGNAYKVNTQIKVLPETTDWANLLNKIDV